MTQKMQRLTTNTVTIVPFINTDALKIIFTRISVVELNFLLWLHSITLNVYFIYCIGTIKLRIESELSSDSVFDTKYNASISITVTERLGITKFKDINLVLSLIAQEKAVMGSEVGKLLVCALAMLGRIGYSIIMILGNNNIMIATVIDYYKSYSLEHNWVADRSCMHAHNLWQQLLI